MSFLIFNTCPSCKKFATLPQLDQRVEKNVITSNLCRRCKGIKRLELEQERERLTSEIAQREEQKEQERVSKQRHYNKWHCGYCKEKFGWWEKTEQITSSDFWEDFVDDPQATFQRYKGLYFHSYRCKTSFRVKVFRQEDAWTRKAEEEQRKQWERAKTPEEREKRYIHCVHQAIEKFDPSDESSIKCTLRWLSNGEIEGSKRMVFRTRKNFEKTARSKLKPEVEEEEALFISEIITQKITNYLEKKTLSQRWYAKLSELGFFRTDDVKEEFKRMLSIQIAKLTPDSSSSQSEIAGLEENIERLLDETDKKYFLNQLALKKTGKKKSEGKKVKKQPAEKENQHPSTNSVYNSFYYPIKSLKTEHTEPEKSEIKKNLTRNLARALKSEKTLTFTEHAELMNLLAKEVPEVSNKPAIPLWAALLMLITGVLGSIWLLKKQKTARERSRKKAWEAKFIKQH